MGEGEREPAIVCLGHLAWDHVWQRPHHVLSRFARRYSVVYVNEPHIEPELDGGPEVRVVECRDRLSAWQPVFPDRPEVIGRWRGHYAEIVEELLVRHGLASRVGSQLVAVRPLILWFYTPTPYYMLERVPARVVVFDVMDDLAGFKGAAADLAWREEQVLRRADVVFAGGRSLFEARRQRHGNIHLLPSGVEPDHFARALLPETPLAEVLVDLPRPILGYVGVIDERIDLALLDALASAHPLASIVLVGPVAKIDEADLPRRANLHYVGQRPYAELPNFLKGFDVCLMPFALNGATRSISPTKALEYMAAHRPIVSTAVPDVVASWSDVVAIARSRDEFVAAIGEVLAESREGRAARERREQELLVEATWDAIVGRMEGLVEQVLAR